MPRTAVVALACALGGLPASAQVPRLQSVAATGAEADTWSARVAALQVSGRLAEGRVHEDPQAPGHRHVRHAQVAHGVPVFGAELVRHLDDQGRTLSVFGRLAEEPVPAAPALTADEAARRAQDHVAGALVVLPTLAWLPLESPPRLAWNVWLRTPEGGLPRVFVDALDGTVLASWDERQTDSALGTGAWGDPKKLSVRRDGARWVARDDLRPAPLATWDLADDLGLAYWHRVLADPGGLHLAADADNDWRDGAVVDAHAYSGVTYDYLFVRHGRRSADGRDTPLKSFVHYRQAPESTYANAFFDPFTGGVYYGDGDGRTTTFAAGLDVVAHEIAHAITHATWNGVYAGESGALNEAFSDIVGASVEFFHQPEGNGRLRADWWLGEDLATTFAPPATVVRSMSDPRAICTARYGCYPDHVAVRYTGRDDGGGVHVNSSIVNHAYFLLVAGGTNRTSGQRVAGISLARRDRAERIFFRGFTSYLTPFATFADARRATLQAARDLYGEGDEVQQVAAAWAAVGVE